MRVEARTICVFVGGGLFLLGALGATVGGIALTHVRLQPPVNAWGNSLLNVLGRRGAMGVAIGGVVAGGTGLLAALIAGCLPRKNIYSTSDSAGSAESTDFVLVPSSTRKRVRFSSFASEEGPVSSASRTEVSTEKEYDIVEAEVSFAPTAHPDVEPLGRMHKDDREDLLRWKRADGGEWNWDENEPFVAVEGSVQPRVMRRAFCHLPLSFFMRPNSEEPIEFGDLLPPFVVRRVEGRPGKPVLYKLRLVAGSCGDSSFKPCYERIIDSYMQSELRELDNQQQATLIKIHQGEEYEGRFYAQCRFKPPSLELKRKRRVEESEAILATWRRLFPDVTEELPAPPLPIKFNEGTMQISLPPNVARSRLETRQWRTSSHCAVYIHERPLTEACDRSSYRDPYLRPMAWLAIRELPSRA